MSYNAITNLQEIVIDDLIVNTATIDTALIQSLDCNVGVIDTLTSTTATITSANIPTITNTNLTSTGKIKAPVLTGNTTSTNISIGESGDTGTNTLYKTINMPSLTASKIVLTDGFDNLISSTLNDTDLAPKNDPTFTTKITTPDIVLNNTRVSLGSTQTTTSLTTGCLIGSNLSNGGFNNVGMINSTGTLITAGGANRFYVSQLRNAQLNSGVLLYDNTTKEVSYSANLPTLTTSGLTITGLTASRAVVSSGTKALSSASFNLPSTSGTNGFLLLTDGTATTSWSDPASLPAITAKANIDNPTFTTKITTPDIVLNNTRVSLGSSQTTTGLNTGCLIGPNCSNGGFDNVLMLNASGTLITSTSASKSHMAPLRNFSAQSGIMLYDNSTKEVAYSLTTPAFTSTNITINGLTASRAVVSNASKLLTSASFNLPATSGSNNNLLSTNGVDTTSWVNSVSLTNGSFSGVLTLGAGSGSFPSLTFTGAEVDTGIWSSGADNINFGTNGGTRCLINNNGLQVPNLTASKIVLSSVADYLVSSAYADTDMAILAVANIFTGSSNTFNNQIVVGAGSVGSPSIAFFGDLNTGIYRTATDNFDISVNAVNKLNISTSAFSPKDTIRGAIGTNTIPTYAFSAETSSGVYQSALGNIDVSVAGTNKLNISASNFNVKNNVQITSGGVDNWIVNGSGNTLFKSSYLSGKYITSAIYTGAETNNWSVFESNANSEASAFCQNGNIQLIINPGDSDTFWYLDEDTIQGSSTNNYAWVGWKISTAGVLVSSSDRRLKRDINKIEKENLLENLLGVNIVKYKKKPPTEDKLFKNGVLRKKYQEEHIGVIGQNVKKHFNDVIEEQDTGDEEKFISVKYQDLSYYFHLGTQALIRKVQVLQDENRNLKTEVEKIKTFLNIQ